MNNRTEKIKKRYNRISSVFGIMDRMIRSSWRKDLLGTLKGNILEVGVGTGSNLPYYPSNVHVTGIDFSPKMLSKAINTKSNIKLREMDVQQMDFPDNTFDVIVSTCVFCSVPDPVMGFKEMRRVLMPEGKIVMLEHMRSENPVVGKMLDLVNPITVRMIGANVNRKTIENIEKARLTVEQESYLMTSIMRKLVLSPNK